MGHRPRLALQGHERGLAAIPHFRFPIGNCHLPFAICAARAKQNPGGDGGSSAMIWTLVGTIAGLAATYFVVKEMQKQTDELVAQQQR